MSTQKTSSFLTKNSKYIIALLIAIIAFGGTAWAVTTLSNPAEENVQGTPTDKPAATPTPTATVAPTELHLSSNVTTPWYKGDTLRMTATLNQPVAGVTVTLLNKGAVMTTGTTNAEGKVVFDRTPLNPFDYSVTASIP